MAKKYYIRPKHRATKQEQTMNQLNWTRIIGVLAIVSQVGNFALAYFAGVIPPDVAVIIAGVLGFISAVTERVQGGASKV